MKSLLKLIAVLAIGVWLVAGNTYPAAASAEEADNQSSQPEAVMQVADAYMAKGESLLRAGKPEEALPHFDKAIEQNPDSAIAYNYRAICHAMTKNLRQALEDAETAVYIDYYYTSVDRFTIKTNLCNDNKLRMSKLSVVDYLEQFEVCFCQDLGIDEYSDVAKCYKSFVYSIYRETFLHLLYKHKHIIDNVEKYIITISET